MYKMPCSGNSIGEKWFNKIEQSCVQLWSTVVLALHSLLQNPQNGERLLKVLVTS